jgi:hypothetical protein
MADQIVRTAVNTSVPVSIIELPDSKFNLNERNPFITHARLKIFYVGQTEDGRLFTEDFSNKLIKTLPQSPVVAYFDEESEDFKAHNQKQYVYGYVPENATIYFEEEDDRVWAFTDVVLFTGRNDNIGEVAKRIMGMQHSLELDPATVQYKVNKDGNGKFRNIEFTEGKFIGLSVVGKSEKPAFSGSHFFTIEEESEMAEALMQFQESIVSYFDCDTKDSNGISLCVFRNLDDIDLKPTQTMANNAKRGLDLRKEFGRGGTEVGVARARDLMNRKNLSPRTVQRMFSYFSRHEVDKQGQGWNSDEEGYPSAGLIA